MKKYSLQTYSSKFVFACIALGLVLTTKTASAQMMTLISPTVNDGGFESITNKSNFQIATSATAAIPYWGATGVTATGAAVGAPSDSGAENDGGTLGATGNNAVTNSGTSGGFWQPSPNSTAFNLVTTNPIVANNVYTLTWFARTTGAGGAQFASLFSQSPSTVTGATYTYQPTATLISVNGFTNAAYALSATNGPFAQYSLTYTATAADAGNLIGLTFGNSNASYVGGDDFTLTVTTPAAAPEPSTYALLFAGLGSVLFVRRLRRASV